MRADRTAYLKHARSAGYVVQLDKTNQEVDEGGRLDVIEKPLDDPGL